MQAASYDDAESGTVQGGSAFAPANFGDAEGNDTRTNNSINSVVSHVALYNISEAAEKLQQTKAWRRKVRDIIQGHQERIIQFMTKPMPNDHPLKVAHNLLAKYGKIVAPNIAANDANRTIPMYIREFIVDISGQAMGPLNQFIGDLEKARASDLPVQRWTNMTRSLLDYMRDVGDELIRIDQRLHNECILLDTVVDKIVQIIHMDNPEIDGFQPMMELYLEKQFLKHPIESLYKDYITTFQKYFALRDILTSQRIMNATEPLCCICMTEVVVMALAPCGHTFCTNCVKRTLSCHVCRQLVQSRVKLYFT